MPTQVLYQLAQQRLTQFHREAQHAKGLPAPRTGDHTRSWSSSAYWHARRR